MPGERIGLVFGGRSVEHRVSVLSARTVAKGLEQAGYEVVPLGISEDGCWLSPSASMPALVGEVDSLAATGGAIAPSLGVLLETEVDVVFPLVHGTWGEDGALQGLCEMADIPYVGAGVDASAVAMDKVLCKRILESVGVPVVDYEAVTRLDFADDPDEALERAERLGLPLFVKPSVGGSSVGVAKVTDSSSLRTSVERALHLSESALIECSVEGRELECSVLGYPRLEASAVGEIRPGREFYDYVDKYLDDGAELLIPADLGPQLESRVRQLAVQSFSAVRGTGMARVDFFLSGGDIRVNEINTLPGFTSISMYPKLWEEVGVSIADLVQRLVSDAIVRHRDRADLDRRIKEFLASLSERS
jgi:D-alanine-D-alanine ligase